MKTNITKNIFMALALSCCLTACEKFLDVQPVGKLIPTEVVQFENLLNNSNTLGSYFMFDNNNGCSYAALGDNIQVSENQLKYQYIGTFPNLDILAAWTYQFPIYNPNSSPMGWSYTWQSIAYFNNVIDGIRGLGADDEYARGVIAQAMIGRAWAYMNYTLCYGPAYDPATANDKKVLPLRTSGDPTQENGPLATTAEIFKQIKEDLDYACENAPERTLTACRGNKTAAYALRAEYNMYIRDFEAMRADAEKAWSLALAAEGSVDKLIYNYSDQNFYYEKVTSVDPGLGEDERLYMEFRGPDTDYNQTTNIELLLYRNTPSGYSRQKYYPSEEWKALFDKDNDWRWLQWAMMAEGFSTTIGSDKYQDGVVLNYLRDQYMKTTQGMTYPLLLLEKAEAEARTGKTSQALESLNTLRKYRYKGTSTNLPNGGSLSQDQLLEEILKERRREQPLISFNRTLDIKRFALDTGKPWCKTSITHKSGSYTYSANVSDPIFQSLPIDNGIIKYNPQWGLEINENTFEPYN
ncbi:MAG: RagB/SusD family nutrient uptake outer membrane protein, partial [Bacteroidales bacterium]|nr:RagB/SusD family nutrient uptake outer membrane protein [Bacteroidales bacterium]